ncbi:MAG: hypothetical protein KAZ85_02510 [Gammaproteobacteria bacterium]|nr:hypothetical protein [Gammaproteobacteria bacterium]
MKQKIISAGLAALLLLLSAHTQAYTPTSGDRVWIDMPAINIDDDAYGQGKVTAIVNDKQSRVYIQSITATKAFSSGISCALNTNDTVAWQTPDVLRTEKEEAFSNLQLYPWAVGYNRYYERQNWLLTFLKWVDRHPVIERDRLTEGLKVVKERGMNDLARVSDLMIMEYDAYQGANFNIYPLPKRLANTNVLLEQLQKRFATEPKLKKLWYSTKRDFTTMNEDSYGFFMIQAIDKIIEDAKKSRRLLSKDLNDSPDAQKFDQLISQFKRG